MSYDFMTGGAERIEKAVKQLGLLVGNLSSKNILDVGCGTGTDSIALARLTCSVIGIDSSPRMIAMARERWSGTEQQVRFEIDDVCELRHVPDKWADMAICRGNLIPHLQSSDDLRRAIKALGRITKPGGILILGWLNYIPILRSRNRVIATTGDEKMVILRFNDFLDDGSLNFNIATLTYDSVTGRWSTDLQTTHLIPWLADDVGMLLAANGWEELEIGSSLERVDFDPDTSRDVFIFAVKGDGY